MNTVNQEVEILGEQRPGIEAIPAFFQVGCNPELGVAGFQQSHDLGRGATQQPAIQPLKAAAQLIEMRYQQLQVKRV